MCKFPRFAETTRTVVGDVTVASAVFRCVTDRQTDSPRYVRSRAISEWGGGKRAC